MVHKDLHNDFQKHPYSPRVLDFLRVLVGAFEAFALDCTEVQEAASALFYRFLVIQCYPVHRRAATYLQRFHRLLTVH